MEILSKAKDISERLFYIHEYAVRAWDKYSLREYIRSGLYHKQGNLPNNYSATLRINGITSTSDAELHVPEMQD